ncbi:uncharacterized protein MONBRDRAFT_11197 [Monosiga brevicollis MX1]|uniref:UDP-galactose transporter n=1 Tax=Monosiga brevicollis TaxID=81824 RepID=A9V8H6_MONBE|nr:uncharacterized protein MONBRDRAFT_11197 [Monosiga brevicollis MX1]EDQ86084.1 predicted protein [Monosiga brevicollis MX1]|eukprot:XP_001749009.1 hypothetical protein [Monosiga brevicollis MX1]
MAFSFPHVFSPQRVFSLVPFLTHATEDQLELNNKAFGLVLVMAACFSSGFAGVYFEKMLKGATAGIWILNVQLASFSVVIALTGLLYTERENIVSNGFFYGFSAWTYTAIGLQAIGGLVVAVVVKYADNILKGFATSISIVISCLLSVHFFDFVVTNRFGLGTVLVLASSYLYGTCPPVSPRTTNAQPTLISVSTEKR